MSSGLPSANTEAWSRRGASPSPSPSVGGARPPLETLLCCVCRDGGSQRVVCCNLLLRVAAGRL